jgi:hypothetical protein
LNGKLPLVALIIGALLLQLMATAPAQECIDTLSGGNRSGELRGPEDSGETHIYCLKAEPGYWLTVELTMTYEKYFSSRIITGLASPSGGFLLYRDDVLPQLGVKVYRYSWYVTAGETDLRLILTSVASRKAPSVVGYSFTISQQDAKDASLVQLRRDSGSESFSLNVGDAPNDPFAEGLPKLPPLKQGETLILTGHLSASVAKETERGAELYGGRDTSDIYALSLEDIEANARLNITVKPPRDASLLLILKAEDGATLTSAASRRPGEEARIATVINKPLKAGRFFVEVQLLRSNTPLTDYTLEILVAEPPKREQPIEVRPPFPEAQARTLVIGFSAAVIAATIASVVIGWFRRRSSTPYPYYW